MYTQFIENFFFFNLEEMFHMRQIVRQEYRKEDRNII